MLPVLLFALLCLTLARNVIWRDKAALWEDVVRKSPGNARAYNNLGETYHERGELDKAIENYHKAIALAPGSSLNAYCNIGSLFISKGQYDKAVEYFTKVLSIDMNDHLAYANRGVAYYAQGKYDKALQDFDKAIALYPYLAQLHTRRGHTLMKMNNRSGALRDFERACALGDGEGCMNFRRIANAPR